MAKFQKGQSGNPSGRPKALGEITELARSYSKEALEKLLDLMRNSPDERVQKAAADSLLDRGLGKPSQPLEHGGPGGTDTEFVLRLIRPGEAVK